MISEGERDFILKTLSLIDVNVEKLEKKIEAIEEELSAKFNQSFVELDAIKFDLNEMKRKLKYEDKIQGVD